MEASFQKGNPGLFFFLIERLAIKAIKTVLSAHQGKLSAHQGRRDYRNLMLIVVNLLDNIIKLYLAAPSDYIYYKYTPF